VLDIGEQQLLVLLFVVQTQNKHVANHIVDSPAINDARHLLVDVSPVIENLRERWPRNLAALRSWMHFPDRVVIGVEQVVVLIIEARYTTGLEHKALEEPGDVGEVPFGRADIRHRLDDGILRPQLGYKRE
jgi:hypothetical protein